MADKAELGEDLTARLEAVESLAAVQGATLQQVKIGLAKALNDFGPVAARVGELSSAFQAANGRLASMEASLAGLEDQSALTGQVEELRVTLAGMDARVTGIETTRARSGRLGNRLAGIEEKLAQLLPEDEPTNGGTP
jgi:hypothetical protein